MARLKPCPFEVRTCGRAQAPAGVVLNVPAKAWTYARADAPALSNATAPALSKTRGWIP
jgi:hypothetical protein